MIWKNAFVSGYISVWFVMLDKIEFSYWFLSRSIASLMSYLLEWFSTISHIRDKVREVSGVLDNYIKHKHYQHATRLLKTNGGFCQWSVKLVNTGVTDNFVFYYVSLPDSACLSVSCVQSWTFVYVLYAEYIVRTFAIIFKSPWQNFTKTSESLVIHKMNILCKNQEVSMCQSRDITWNTRKYREMCQNLRTFAIIFKSPWQNFTKTSESLVLHTMSILCKNQEVSMCQSREITWNTRKYREMSQNLRTFAIIFKIPWQNFTKTSKSLVIHKMNILCKNQEVSMCQSQDITWNTRKYRQISQNLRTLAIIFKIPWQNFTKTSESLVLHTMSIL